MVEDGEKLVIEAHPNLERLHGDTENLLSEIFDLERLIDDKGNQFVTGVIQTLQQLSITARYIFSRDTLELNESQLILSFDDDRNVTVNVNFWGINPESIKINLPEAALQNEDKTVSFGFLFLKPDRSGWTEHNHMLITAEAIKLIKIFDKQGHYEEIYNNGSFPDYYQDNQDILNTRIHHPTVHGAWAEDAWDDIRTSAFHRFYEKDSIPSLTYRSFNHFGYGEDGLQWQDYFFLISKDVRKPQNGKFVSALYWGKEDGKKHEETKFWLVDSYGNNGKWCSYKNDPMNFKGAIKVYGDGDDEGRIEGYRRMGHVLHLLQDLAQPDHAQRKDHAGSAKTHQEAVNMFNFCDAKMAQDFETALVVVALGGPVGAIAGVVMVVSSCFDNDECKSGSLNRVGFERLIKDKWKEVTVGAPWEKTLNYVEIFKRHLANEGYDYNTVFINMGIDATRFAESRNLTLPLGLGPLTVAISAYIKMMSSDKKQEQQALKHLSMKETIPGLRPLINVDNQSSYKPYIELAREVIDKAILRSSSMLIHFLDVVNPPPIVQSVAVAKGVAGLIPSGYAKFKQNQTEGGCSNTFIAYKSRWENSINIRTKKIDKDYPLSSNHSIYVFVEFGPKLWSGVSRQMKKDSLVLLATSPRGFFSPIYIQLKSSTDKSTGEYYWGSFIPPKLGGEYDILFEIKGKDDTAHLVNRGQKVRLLDSYPSTVAHVDVKNAPDYPFIDYEPGSDKNHLIHVTRGILKDQLERNDGFYSSTRVILTEESPSANFSELTIDLAEDVDFFHIKYESSKKDDNVTMSGKQSLHGGLYLDIQAPKLEFWIFEEFNCCISLRIYYGDKTVFRDYEIVDNNTLPFLTIEAPSVKFNNNNDLYIAIKNPDYKMQGPLRYDLNINYVPARAIIKGKLLYEFWKFYGYPVPLTFPPPPIRGRQPFKFVGNPPDSVIYHDLDLLLEHLHQFANNFHPSTEMTKNDKDIWSARFNNEIGMFAKKLRRDQDAIKYFRESSTLLAAHNRMDEANISKQLLKESLINTNQIGEARKIIINR